MKRYLIVSIPKDADGMFINNVGCLRYTHNKGRESSVIEPDEMGVYLEKNKHHISGESFYKNKRYVIIKMD